MTKGPRCEIKKDIFFNIKGKEFIDFKCYDAMYTYNLKDILYY